jgi:protoporphyrinogen oxidase
VCASLLIDRPLSPFYVTNITDDGFPFTGVIEMTALVDPVRFGRRHLIYLPRYLASDDAYLEASDDQVQEDFLSGLARMHPDLGDAEILAFEVSRVRYVMPIPTIGYSKGLPAERSSLPGVYFVNSSHIVNGTLNVNETITLAEGAARRLLEDGPADSIRLEAP